MPAWLSNTVRPIAREMIGAGTRRTARPANSFAPAMSNTALPHSSTCPCRACELANKLWDWGSSPSPCRACKLADQLWEWAPSPKRHRNTYQVAAPAAREPTSSPPAVGSLPTSSFAEMLNLLDSPDQASAERAALAPPEALAQTLAVPEDVPAPTLAAPEDAVAETARAPVDDQHAAIAEVLRQIKDTSEALEAPDPPEDESQDSQQTCASEQQRVHEKEMDRELQEFLVAERMVSDASKINDAKHATIKHRSLCTGLLHRGITWIGPEEHFALRESPVESELNVIHDVYFNKAVHKQIYIGGTQFPLRRFLGDKELIMQGMGRLLDPDARPMDGHKHDKKRQWDSIIFWGVRWGPFGALTEVAAIHYAKFKLDPLQSTDDEFGNPLVVNAVIDSRGLSKDWGVITFLYICLNPKAKELRVDKSL